MTDLEIKRQKADLLLEYQEAQQHLAHLQEKARRLGESLSRITQWLRKSSESSWNFNPAEPIYVMGDYVKILEDPRYEAAMDFSEIKKVVQEIKEATDNLQSLGKRKNELGLK